MSKNIVPCGGFELDKNFLGMNKNGELSLAVGAGEDKAYKQLVTDKDGEAKWEDRLAYGGNRIRVSTPELTSRSWYKVSDDLPTGSYDIGTRIYIIDSDEDDYAETIEVSNGEVITNDSYEPKVIVALHDNVTFLSEDGWSITLPEKGTYFAKNMNYYIAGVVIGDGNEPEITWDGSVFVGKKIEQMYIPKQTIYLTLDDAGISNDIDCYKISMTLDEVNKCISNNINVVLVNEHYDVPCFYYLSECNSVKATFVCISPDFRMEKFTITADSSRGPIDPVLAYLKRDGYDSQDSYKFLAVSSSGYVSPSSNLILPSSTSGSSKKFKITVNDSGTITATEVTT